MMRTMLKYSILVVVLGGIASGAFIAGRMNGAGAQPSGSEASHAELVRMEERVSARLDRLEQLVVASMNVASQSNANRGSPEQEGKVASPPPPTSVPGDPDPVQKQSRDEPAPTTENIVAFEGAQRVVDEALARKTWGEQERNELVALLNGTTSTQRRQIIDEIVLAINAGQLSPTVMPPF